jgi:DNA-binding LacI/PurR family transcriptional regulator
MHEFIERGIRVPDDVAVMGFDDIEEARYSSPSLSTVSPDTDAIATYALDLLLGEATDDDTGEKTIPFDIVKRAST